MNKETYRVLDGWSNVRHITKNGIKPFCGSKFKFPKPTVEIKYDDDLELKEYWTSEIQGNKWVKVASYNYCQRCLKSLKKALEGKKEEKASTPEPSN